MLIKRNQVSRRSVFVGAAAIAGALATHPPHAVAEKFSELAELIADFNMKEEEEMALYNRWEALTNQYNDVLPKIGVTYQARVIVQGVESTYPRIFRDEPAIERFFARDPRSSKLVNAAKRTNCRRLIAELRQVETAHDQMRLDLGITEVFNQYERCSMASRKLIRAVFGYRPKSLEEMDTKNVFMAAWFKSGCGLSDEEVALVFGSAGSA
ncbi:hypothetical protein [Mesorhizobium sp. LNHC229A00]|uniref:hypothetical protein n=1 Tax=Mesorhizobium sp. LNHC229A00 TaxID=1287240 RepID=UPI0003CDE89A|nr:hypothetical protein [Mesorhizobium sp. LNHC229A00]ESY92304.1 hypothetical protein X741_21600 [Mesorhizobium sp. LNHC229A00]